ncbi:pyruvate, phosphate dikinase [Loigolactobacillus jiayinensis]|uniref:Pyruvate, phosphate dikinase n=1 Tax=Loigolactobacillus jiayinensis TaxID=2486016 RepID=A0ABW1RF85_9LACO|nr:pyruvate, phosphate dikinase [Loigolactobacillus jiayinensis]
MQQIYFFNEGRRDMRSLLGGKGANLAEMTHLGLPVPQGFTISTVACHDYEKNQNQLSAELRAEIAQALGQLEEITEKQFNSVATPLLVSVRSGAAISMPGMMDTILNLGLNDQTVIGLAEQTQNERFAWDCYRRLLQMFGNVVYGIPEQTFESVLANYKRRNGYRTDLDMTAADLKAVATRFQELYLESGHGAFPQSPQEQLELAVAAVFTSWQNPRAQVYRELHHIDNNIGTAVNVQAMVFGNSGADSGTGVAFTRDPVTGKHKIFGEFLQNAQGEDVVSGVRTPQGLPTMAEMAPQAYQQFLTAVAKLEKHYHDMQDVEFTLEHGKLYFLQTRSGKRTAKAAVKIAVDQVGEGLIDRNTALLRVDPEQVSNLLHPEFAAATLAAHKPLTKGLPASPGAASGKIYFTAPSAKAAHEAGEQVILVRQDTSPEDIEGMVVSEAIVTSRGGMTSHAAVVARGMGKCGVVGCEHLIVDQQKQQVTINGTVYGEGSELSVDGASGQVYAGVLTATQATQDQNLQTLLSWAKEIGQMDVYANADTANDFAQALSFGANGIGLTRTEHMFFKSDRLLKMRRLIIAGTALDRVEPLAELQELQTEDFYQIYRLAQGKTVTIRLLDPPLHEFLPHDAKEMARVADALNMSVSALEKRVAVLHEANPMLGHRGCRLAVTYPDIYEMQVTAIVNAALRLKREGVPVKPHIMVPLIDTLPELKWLKARLVAKINALLAAAHTPLHYQIGIMIEMPRACLIADQLAQSADFFSFGTNDLTQLTFGYSRDDIGSFLPTYLDQGILKADPFKTLDVEGVGKLMKMAVDKGRYARRSLPIGVCGELGGDPASIRYFASIGIDYVSVSPFRVPSAILASAQATLQRNYQASKATVQAR